MPSSKLLLWKTGNYLSSISHTCVKPAWLYFGNRKHGPLTVPCIHALAHLCTLARTIVFIRMAGGGQTSGVPHWTSRTPWMNVHCKVCSLRKAYASWNSWEKSFLWLDSSVSILTEYGSVIATVEVSSSGANWLPTCSHLNIQTSVSNQEEQRQPNRGETPSVSILWSPDLE